MRPKRIIIIILIDLNICLKKITNLDNSLNLNIKELYKELINIYEFFVKSEKIKELDIYNLISILMFSVSESPDSNNIESLRSNLDNLLKLINKGFHEKNESYYKLFIYYLMKENEKKMKNIKCIYYRNY